MSRLLSALIAKGGRLCNPEDGHAAIDPEVE